MTNQAIPAEAVEAAAKVLYLEDHLWDEPWETASDAEKYRTNARLTLEAAAPHIAESSNDVQWGVRDKASLRIAGHPSEESARLTAAAHPNWYEVVSRPRPKPEPRWEVS